MVIFHSYVNVYQRVSIFVIFFSWKQSASPVGEVGEAICVGTATGEDLGQTRKTWWNQFLWFLNLIKADSYMIVICPMNHSHYVLSIEPDSIEPVAVDETSFFLNIPWVTGGFSCYSSGWSSKNMKTTNTYMCVCYTVIPTYIYIIYIIYIYL